MVSRVVGIFCWECSCHMVSLSHNLCSPIYSTYLYLFYDGSEYIIDVVILFLDEISPYFNMLLRSAVFLIWNHDDYLHYVLCEVEIKDLMMFALIFYIRDVQPVARGPLCGPPGV